MPLAISSIAEAKQLSPGRLTASEKQKLIEKLTKDMKQAAKELDFESAAIIRDRIRQLMS